MSYYFNAANLKLKERRLAERRQLTGLLPGKLLMACDRRQLSGRPVDLSRHGIGIVMAEQLKNGTEVVLVLKDQEITLQVAWQQPDFGKQDLNRYGLVVCDPAIDLEALFAAADCLR